MNNSTRNHGKDQPAVGPPTVGLLGGHPVGTGLGAVAGGVAAGALAGSMAGPVGTAVGAAIGAVTGGLAGKAIGDVIDTSAEEGYWREHFTSRPYVASGSKVVHSSRPNRI
jgi:phage tail tape-measure protein